MMFKKYWIYIVTFLIAFLLGLGLGWKLYHQNKKPTGGDQRTIYVRDTSVVFKVVHDTILKDKLIQLPGTTIIGEGQVVVKPGVDVIIRDTLINIDTISVDKGTKVSVIRRSNGDSLGHAIVKWPNIRLNFLEDKKTNNYRVQAKVVNGSGTIVDEIFVPRKSVTVSDMNNTIGIFGNYSVPSDGTVTTGRFGVGLYYDRGMGPFVLGVQGGTTIKDWANVSAGIHTGIRF